MNKRVRMFPKLFFRYPFYVIGLISAFVILLLRYFALNYYRVQLTAEDVSNMQNFIQWLGVLYGIYLAKLIDDAIKNFDEMQFAFSDEERVLRTLVGNLLLLSNEYFQKMQLDMFHTILMYCRHVLRHSFEERIRGEVRGKGNEIEAKLRLHLLLAYRNQQEQLGDLSVFMENVNDIALIRRDRLDVIGASASSNLWSLALIFSSLWIIPFITFSYINEIVSSILIGGATFVIASLLGMIYEINNPFKGIWQIDLEPWEDLENTVKAEIDNIVAMEEQIQVSRKRNRRNK